MNRRSLLLSAAGAGLAVSGLAAPRGSPPLPRRTTSSPSRASARPPSSCSQTSTRGRPRRRSSRAPRPHDLAHGALSATEHAAALAKLLTDAGQTAAVAEDFEFAWPDGTFATRRAAGRTGLEIARPLLGVYVGAAIGVSIASYRTLFTTMAANVAQQVAALSRLSGGRMVGVSFPPAVDVETASDAIEAYLG